MATTRQDGGTDTVHHAYQGGQDGRRSVAGVNRVHTLSPSWLKGPNQIGVREAYSVEYFAVPERHTNFEENGFHWHLLVKGFDFIPHDILKEPWRSARHGEAYIVDVQAIRKPHVIGYVNKYLTKSLSRGEKGVRHEEREVGVLSQDEDGNMVEERHTYTVELVSHARRIRYSRHFFPEKVPDLRARLFAEIELGSMEQTATESSTEDSIVGEALEVDNGKPLDTDEAPEVDNCEPIEEEKIVKQLSWSLVKCEEFTDDIQEYRRRKALLEALIDLREGRNLSRRVMNIWAYQRNELRWAS